MGLLEPDRILHGDALTTLRALLLKSRAFTASLAEELSGRNLASAQNVCRDEIVLEFEPLVGTPRLVERHRAFQRTCEDICLAVVGAVRLALVIAKTHGYAPLSDVEQASGLGGSPNAIETIGDS